MSPTPGYLWGPWLSSRSPNWKQRRSGCDTTYAAIAAVSLDVTAQSGTAPTRTVTLKNAETAHGPLRWAAYMRAETPLKDVGKVLKEFELPERYYGLAFDGSHLWTVRRVDLGSSVNFGAWKSDLFQSTAANPVIERT